MWTHPQGKQTSWDSWVCLWLLRLSLQRRPERGHEYRLYHNLFYGRASEAHHKAIHRHPGSIHLHNRLERISDSHKSATAVFPSGRHLSIDLSFSNHISNWGHHKTDCTDRKRRSEIFLRTSFSLYGSNRLAHLCETDGFSESVPGGKLRSNREETTADCCIRFHFGGSVSNYIMGSSPKSKRYHNPGINNRTFPDSLYHESLCSSKETLTLADSPTETGLSAFLITNQICHTHHVSKK